MKSYRILFASVSADGHFNPLTSLAVHFKKRGHDVRWYASERYQKEVEELAIPFYPQKKAKDIWLDNGEELLQERTKHKTKIGRLKFDLKQGTLFTMKQSIGYYEDIEEIHNDFSFDLMVADISFTGLLFISEKIYKPAIAIGVVPLMERSRDLPPNGLGLTPVASLWGRIKQYFMRFVSDVLVYRESNALLKNFYRKNGLKLDKGNVYDAVYRKSTMVLQSGVPGFEYDRSDLSSNVRFIGPILQYRGNIKSAFKHAEKVKAYNKVILVTQGTCDKNPEKIIVPSLEAFKDTDYLVIVTAGGSQTNALRERYPQPNIIIEDYIAYDAVMPYCHVYVTNGGYGGVLLSIKHKLPLVVAGLDKGRNEINARVGFFKAGINLNTETPNSEQIRESVVQVLDNACYKSNIDKLNDEFAKYDPLELCEKYVHEVLNP